MRDDERRQDVRIVADERALDGVAGLQDGDRARHQVGRQVDAFGGDRRRHRGDRELPFGGVPLEQFALRHHAVAGDEIDASFADVALDTRDEVVDREAVGVAFLGHQIAVVDHLPLGPSDRFRDAFHEEVRQDAAVEVAGTDDDAVGGVDGLDGLRVGVDLRLEAQVGVLRELRDLDGVLAVDADVAAPADEPRVLRRDGHDRAAGRQHHAGDADSLVEVAGDLLERRQEDVAEVVPLEAAFLETVVEELADDGVRFRDGDEALAHVAGRQHAELVAQDARRAAVVGHRDDGRKLHRIFLQAGQQGELSRAAADRDDAFHAYSTVTDFARLRGLSTSRPLATAVSYASIWSGMTDRIGWTSGCVSGISMTSSPARPSSFAPPEVVTTNVRAPRARTSSMFDFTFSKTASRGASVTIGKPFSTMAIGPCFISPDA